MLHSSVGELVDWVYETIDDYDMAMFLSKYLIAHGEIAFEDAVPEIDRALDDPHAWTQLVKEIDSLGWDCLLEGKATALSFCTHWIPGVFENRFCEQNPLF